MFEKMKKKMDKEIDKKHAERMARAVPQAKAVLKMILSKLDEMELGDVTADDTAFHGISKDILSYFVEENVRWSDREFIFQLAMQAIDFPRQIIERANNQNWDFAVAGATGKKYVDLGFKDVDALVKKGVEIIRK